MTWKSFCWKDCLACDTDGREAAGDNSAAPHSLAGGTEAAEESGFPGPQQHHE